jgi:hypothetical protein
MKLLVDRYRSKKTAAYGILRDITSDKPKFLCYTLENPNRDVKIEKQTCIPDGTYPVTLRKEGGMHAKYKDKFKDTFEHKGMLWIRGIPNFDYVLIHIGNYTADTDGCVLVGDDPPIQTVLSMTHRTVDFLPSSTTAYKRIYRSICDAIERGETVLIKVKTNDFPENLIV